MGGVGGSGKAKRPIGVKFEIPYFTTSGIQVRYLKIIEPKVSFLLSAARIVRSLRWLSDDDGNSYNTPRSPGSDTSRSQAISQCGYQTSRGDDFCYWFLSSGAWRDGVETSGGNIASAYIETWL